MATRLKIRGLIAAVMCVLLISGFESQASEVKSLDEVTATSASVEAEVQTEEQVESEGTGSNKSNSNSGFIKGLADAADLSEYSETAAKIGSKGNGIGSLVFQVLAYLIPVALGILGALDFIAITIPPFRGLLTGGQGPMQGQQNQGMDSGFGGSSFGNGFGGGSGFGNGGGFGNSFGGNNFGGNSFGGNAGMGMSGRGAQTANGKHQIVSDAALVAIGKIQQVGTFKALGEYFMATIAMYIIIAVLLVLAGTGIGPQLGLTLGKHLLNFLKGLVSI